MNILTVLAFAVAIFAVPAVIYVFVRSVRQGRQYKALSALADRTGKRADSAFAAVNVARVELENALERIQALEAENQILKRELEYLKGRTA